MTQQNRFLEMFARRIRPGWDSTGCEFAIEEKSPFQVWWETTPGKPLNKLRVQDAKLAVLAAAGRLSLSTARHALFLRDMDFLNSEALLALTSYKYAGYQYVFNAAQNKCICLKCACGKIRAKVAWFYSNEENTFYVACPFCGRRYSIVDEENGKIREVSGPFEVEPFSDPSFDATLDSLCHFMDRFIEGELAGSHTAGRARQH